MGLIEIRPGRKVWVETHSPPAKSSSIAILVHGSCARLEQYAAQLELLHNAGIATAAYDYLGCGRSDKPNQYSAYAASELYADLQAVFRKYSEGYTRVVLIGHSYGCYLVNRLASTEEVREKVSVVVLIGAGYPVAGYNHLRWIFYLPTFVLAWLQPFLTDQFIKLAFHPDTFHTNPALIERERGWSNQNPPYMFRAFHLQALSLFRDAAEYDGWLRQIRAPVLAIAGDKDALTPLLLGKMVVKRVRSGQAHEIALGGHQVMEEQPAAFNEMLLGFLKEHSPAS
ncbi:g6486 [Coccomyxa viridis]|uniref:G6486 protein n=1 Tax=Coccomyxa viridis TaxID=1274662 RepID=A0ABP1G215_9CHLO